jgi:hypothetical protein
MLRHCFRLSLACALLAAAAAAPAQPQGVPLMKAPLGSASAAPAKPATAMAPAAGGARTITWEALVPADWDPFKEFRGLDFQMLGDGDPRAMALMKKMREVWDHAPVNQSMVGQHVRIPGFVVPLEDSKQGLKEFLLVPYFGACIHSPPPPSNQIIDVLPRTPAKGLRSMDAVWISGTLTQEQVDSFMGAASWRLEALSVTPYTEPKR